MNPLRERRILVPYTVQQLAFLSGVSRPTIHNIENGRISNPHPITLTRLAGALGWTAGELAHALLHYQRRTNGRSD